jgi:hypothetical protein
MSSIHPFFFLIIILNAAATAKAETEAAGM